MRDDKDKMKDSSFAWGAKQQTYITRYQQHGKLLSSCCPAVLNLSGTLALLLLCAWGVFWSCVSRAPNQRLQGPWFQPCVWLPLLSQGQNRHDRHAHSTQIFVHSGPASLLCTCRLVYHSLQVVTALPVALMLAMMLLPPTLSH